MSAPEPQAPPGFSAMAQALLDDVARLGAGQEQVSEMLLLACATACDRLPVRDLGHPWSGLCQKILIR